MKDKDILDDLVDCDDETLEDILAELNDSDYDEIESADTDTLIEVFGDDFVEGLDSMALLMGKIHSLELVGIKPQGALDYLLQLEAMAYEKEVMKESNKITLELARYSAVENEKTI